MAEMLEAGADTVMAEAPTIGDVAPVRSQTEHSPDHPGQPLRQGSEQHTHELQEPTQRPQQQTGQPAHPQPESASAPPASDASPVPAAFPKKRRGRPPGRPNTTVRDADYEEDPMVQAWNAAKGERAVPVITVGIRAALTEQSLVHDTQRAIFRLPSRETIHFVQGWITAKHIASQRPSYVNGLLIHSRGQDAPVSCVQCAEKRAKNALGPFLACRVLPGTYHNSCSNCKWFDNTSTCSLYTGPKPNRKRKAKEQPPPPSPASVGPPSNANGVNGEAPGTVLEADDKGMISELQHSDAQPRLQPEADMTSVQEDHREEQPDVTPATEPSNVDPGPLSQPHTEVDGSELADVPSQPDSLMEAHFVLPKAEREENAREDDEDDADFVAAQLAAQLLPEIQRQDT